MFVLSIDRHHPDRETVQKVVNLLHRGFIVAYATDTAYGFGADATRRDAIERIYRLKGRSWNKQLPVIVSSFAMAKRYVSFSTQARALAKRFWPGPLTLVLPVTPEGASALHIRRGDTIAVRVPASPLARALVRALGGPITATSANKSGGPDCYTVESIRAQFEGSEVLPDCLLNSGAFPIVKPSTMVEIVDGAVRVVREGPIQIHNTE